VLVAFLAVVMYTDARWTRIPNVITYPTMLAGLVFGVFEGFPGTFFQKGFIDHLAAMILAFALCYPFYAFGGLKAGDAKLLMAIGAMRGTGFLLASALYGALLSGIFALFVIAFRMMRPAPDGGPNSMGKVMKSWMPYGVGLALGGLLALALEAAGVIGARPA
jgi:prepilin peptidase CpaA